MAATGQRILTKTRPFFGQSNVFKALPVRPDSTDRAVIESSDDRTWYARTNADGSMQCSPNADFSTPVYDAFIDGDGSMVFWDTMANCMIG